MQRLWKRECLSSLSYLFFLIFNAHLLRFLVNWHPANLVQPLAWDQALQWGGKGEKNSASDASWAKAWRVVDFSFAVHSVFFFFFPPLRSLVPGYVANYGWAKTLFSSPERWTLFCWILLCSRLFKVKLVSYSHNISVTSPGAALALIYNEWGKRSVHDHMHSIEINGTLTNHWLLCDLSLALKGFLHWSLF